MSPSILSAVGPRVSNIVISTYPRESCFNFRRILFLVSMLVLVSLNGCIVVVFPNSGDVLFLDEGRLGLELFQSFWLRKRHVFRENKVMCLRHMCMDENHLTKLMCLLVYF